MTFSTATALGKIILFGEHAVVYNRPALAIPLSQLRATCHVSTGKSASGIRLLAPDIGRDDFLTAPQADDAVSIVVYKTLQTLGIAPPVDISLNISSTIPIARGLGSGAAISTAIVKALSNYFKQTLSTQAISNLVFEVEKIYHGTPSGIDNTVIAYAQPVFFQRGQTIERLQVLKPLTLVIGDTGIASPTHKMVNAVRQRWQATPNQHEVWFDKIASLSKQAKAAIEQGLEHELGPIMLENHQLLAKLGVSTPLLDGLVQTALDGGATGAKLSGAGGGGNMIALVKANQAQQVAVALSKAGAKNTIITHIDKT